MSKIKVMSETLSNRIAAGEVIERPASVVKELLENAVDAGARRIRIEIERAGSRLISVSDDGSGMDADDALLCIEPHGTSKIFDEKDIDHITTLGFRGEALPSIASISRLTIQTRTADSREGTLVKVDGGRLLEASPSGGAVGTTVQVRDLFYNTPARRKFLKSPMTEAGYVSELVERLALSHPDISFQFINNGQTKLHTSGNHNLKDVIYHIYGRDVAANLAEIDAVQGPVRICGYIGKPVISRGNRG